MPRRISLLSLLALAAVLFGSGCPGQPAGPPDGGPPKVVLPPPPDPQMELAALIDEVKRQLPGATVEQLQALDAKLYDKLRALDPGSLQVQRAGELRGEIKAQLVPAHLAMAEASFKAGRYDDAARQVGLVPDVASPDVVARKKAITAKLPGILARRAACAKTASMKACRIREEHPTWPLKTCQALADEAIGLEMTPEMVQISWGNPSAIEPGAGEKGEITRTWRWPNGGFVVFTGRDEASLKVTAVSN